MKRFQRSAASTCAVLLLVLAGAAMAGADEKDKDKPKGPTLDDAKGTLTETVDGKAKETKIDLKYCLKVKGHFDDKGFNIDEVEADGPATKLDNMPGASLEKGDIILEVDGKKIKSAQDYAKAMNGAADHSKTKIKVRDVRSGDEREFEVDAAKR